MSQARRHGGQILVDALKLHGVNRVFSVPGESFLPVLDGLYESGITNIVCRHEGGAAMMAEATGKLTGRPGICLVTRGPGASNASSGVHVARQDSTPMILFIGQIARGHRDREAFQEVDYRAMFGPLAKWVAEIDDVRRIPEYLARAFHVAMSGRPGPVVLALPEDMLFDEAEVPDLPPSAPSRAGVSDADLDALLGALAKAERPLVIAGGGSWSDQARANLQSFAEILDLPVAVTFRRHTAMDNRSASYVGDLAVGMNPKLAARLKAADLLLIMGARFGDIATDGFSLIDPAQPGKIILWVHPDPDLPGAVFRSDLTLTARTETVLAALAARLPATASGADGSQDDSLAGEGALVTKAARQSPAAWSAWRAEARADYKAWQRPKETPGAVKLEQVMDWLVTRFDGACCMTMGAGNYAGFVSRYAKVTRRDGLLGPTSGSMGYGFPAAIAAKLQSPDLPVICFAGDGCFQMTLNEMSTAAQHGAAVIVIVANNGQYGTIRAHQEREFPARVSGTKLANPDYAALARAYGGHGETVTDGADFPAAFERADASGKISVIELQLDPEALSHGATLTQARERGLALQAAKG